MMKLKVGRAYTKNASPLAVPLLFWITGVLGIIAGFWRLGVAGPLVLRGLVGVGPVLTSVHLFTLAGFTMVMMGALYQLTPVLLNCAPVRLPPAVIQWGIYTVAVAFFVIGLNVGQAWVIASGASGLVVGIAFFLINVLGRLGHRTTWNITAWFFLSALTYLALTVVLGGCWLFATPSVGLRFRMKWPRILRSLWEAGLASWLWGLAFGFGPCLDDVTWSRRFGFSHGHSRIFLSWVYCWETFWGSNGLVLQVGSCRRAHFWRTWGIWPGQVLATDAP